MQGRSRAVAGRPPPRDRLSGGHDIAWLDKGPIEMSIEGAELGVAHHHNVEPVAAALAVDRHYPACRCMARGIERRRQVDAAVEVTTGACLRRGFDLEGGAAKRLRKRG